MKRPRITALWVDQDTHINIKTLAAKKGVPIKKFLKDCFKGKEEKDDWRFF